jgi:dGTPase
MDSYNEFDQQCFPEARGTNDYRSPFAIDRDRVIHSRAFRRLQAKTQVFNSGEYDFYRTRLTHSVEVGQIGRSICKFLEAKDSTFIVDCDLVEAACLSHDLGNPPFGHSGERTLHSCMEKFGGFEGNAQTMRLITERIFTENHGRTGMKPTRAFLDAICKYKTVRIPGMKNHFLYKDQSICLEFIHDEEYLKDQSLECQIMDWSDDIANGYADVNDGYKAKLVNIRTLEVWASSQKLDTEQQADLEQLLGSIRQEGDTEKFRARGIGECIRGVSMGPRSNKLSSKTPRHAYQLEIDPRVSKRCKLMKAIAHGIVIQSALVQQLEMKTHRMMKSLFEMLLDNYTTVNPKSLLPHESHAEIIGAHDDAAKARYICDHLSGMSDDFAVRTYRRLFEPTFGSIGDFI